MSLVTFQIPEESQQLTSWLEQQLVGRNLRSLVVELKAILGPLTQNETLSEICGRQLTTVLSQGLIALSPDVLRRLLKSPQSLFELQESIFIEGDEYWRSVPRTQEHSQSIEAALPLVQMKTFGVATPKEKVATVVTPSVRPGSRRFGFLGGVLGVVLAAACLFIAVTLWQPPGAPTWGFDRAGVLTANVGPREYLDTLANAAGDWFKKRPVDKPSLAKRLAEFRHGCDTLIAAEHPQLTEKDRLWLRERCGVWAGKIDGHLADLGAGTKSVEQVQADADATINALVKALRTRMV